MATVTTKDRTTIFYKYWGPKDARPIMFHHGWPLSSDDWDAQMLFFIANGYRVVAHDRRGHGRSAQVSTGHDMDHYASDASAVVEHLDLKNAIHIGHSRSKSTATPEWCGIALFSRPVAERLGPKRAAAFDRLRRLTPSSG